MRLSLRDEYSRSFRYLRLSVTDACNFRCGYCLPDGYSGCAEKHFLSTSEINNLVAGFRELGIQKIRLTGGEPTLRRDILDIISTIKQQDPDLQVALTTNGFRLPALLPDLKVSGVDALNISLDSLRPDRFKSIRGRDMGAQVKHAVDMALEMGFRRVKVNAVLLKGENDDEIPQYMEWLRDRPISARFIELMRTNENPSYFKKHFISSDVIKTYLLDQGWQEEARATTDGPAQEFKHPEYMGRIGVIAPYSKNFCDSCNRLRISARGALRLCLFGDGDYNMRPYLQSPQQKEELIAAVVKALKLKPKAHRLHEQMSGNMASLSTIGG